MVVTRRKFVQSSLLAAAGLRLTSFRSPINPFSSQYFGIHPFILQHPDAVFIMKTDIENKTNGDAIKKAGLDFGRSVFSLTGDNIHGIPLTHKVVIKPNLTCRQRNHDKYTVLGTMGIITDVFFVEGIIESLKELGIPSGQFYIREVNCSYDLADGGYLDMAERTGIDLQGIDTPDCDLSPEQVNWKDVPDAVWIKKITYL